MGCEGRNWYYQTKEQPPNLLGQRERLVDFQSALAELQRGHPDAELGVTVQEGGSYYEAASSMTYNRVNEDVFRSTPGLSRMWLYYSHTYNRICCGPKEWQEYENDAS